MGRRRHRSTRTDAPETPAATSWTIPAAILLGALAVMAAWTWRKWVDPFVDFGQAMEIAREVAGGKVPYRDVALLHGPLSAGIDALLFRLFGATISTLTTFNLAVVAALTALLVRLLADAFDRFAATAGGLLFLLVFAFGQYTPASITNYVAPYTPEIVHGLALGLLAVFFASRAGRSGRPADAALAGLSVGLTFLTKPETFLAAFGGAGAGILLAARVQRRSGRPTSRLVLPFLAGLGVPPLGAFLVFLRWLPTEGSVLAALGPWPALLRGGVPNAPFYRWVTGTDDVAGNVGKLFLWTGALVAVFGGAAWWTRQLGPRRKAPGYYAVLGLAAAALATTFGRPEWLELSRPLPVILAAAIVVECARLRHALPTAEPGGEARIPLAVFGLLLLLKTPLASRLYHYGQFLSMPGFLFAAAFLLTAFPLAIDRKGGNGRAFRHLAVVFLALLVGKGLFLTRAFMVVKTCSIGSGANRFHADGRGCLLEAVRGEIASLARPGQTLAVLPEGSLLNVLTGLSRPTPFGTLMPFEARLYGEGMVRDAFEEHPPDWVVLVHKDTSEYGPRFFGRDYLRGLGAFLAQRYTPVARWGAEPFTGKEFGVKLLKRSE